MRRRSVIVQRATCSRQHATCIVSAPVCCRLRDGACLICIWLASCNICVVAVQSLPFACLLSIACCNCCRCHKLQPATVSCRFVSWLLFDSLLVFVALSPQGSHCRLGKGVLKYWGHVQQLVSILIYIYYFLSNFLASNSIVAY